MAVDTGATTSADDKHRVALGFGGLTASMGDHIGHFYENAEERTKLAVSFVTAGLTAGERCVILASADARPELEKGLVDAGIFVEDALASGQLLIHEGDDEPEKLRRMLSRVLQEIPGRYSLLRWVGDMTWSLGKMPTTEKLMEWESHCNAVENPTAIFLCQYDLTTFRANVVMDALRTHPTCVVSNAIHRNPFYQEPETFLEDLRRKGASPLTS